MSGWADVVVAATVGTATRRPDLTTLPAPVAAVLPAGVDPATGVLAAAAAFTLATRAGGPDRVAPLPEPAPVDLRPVLSDRGADVVADVLASSDAPLVAQLCRAVTAAGRRLPGRLLPGALALAAREASVRPAVLAAAGPATGWLGARNPAWAFAARPPAPSPGTDPWTTGSVDHRREHLTALAAQDPPAAAALLAADWAGTVPDERVGLLQVLATRPDPAAEPVLETALDDRRAAVRQAAAIVLSRLPSSALLTRAADRARGLLAVERGRIVVTRPAAPDPGARRDAAATGPAAHWLTELVGAAPLGLWPDALGLEAAALTALPVDDLGPQLHAGWAWAARRQLDATWAGALLATAHAAPDDVALRLLDVLDPPARESATVRILRAATPERATAALTRCPGPWSPAFGAEVGRWLHDLVRAPGRADPGAAFGLAALGLPVGPGSPDHAAALLALADDAPVAARWAHAARRAARTLTIRRLLSEELA